jgi:hypothetical protein
MYHEVNTWGGRRNCSGMSSELSEYFMPRLSQMEFKHPATVRIKGLPFF